MKITALLIPANPSRNTKTVSINSLDDAYKAINADTYMGPAIEFARIGKGPLEFIADENGLAPSDYEINLRALVIRQLEKLRENVGTDLNKTQINWALNKLSLAVLTGGRDVMNHCLVGDLLLSGGVDEEGNTVSASETDRARIAGYLENEEIIGFIKGLADIWNLNYRPVEEEEEESPFRFTYMMLSRLEMDCKYFLGHGNRNPKDLWGVTVVEHIAEMKRLWQELPEDSKPEWLTWAKIEEYESFMTADVNSRQGV